MAGNLRRCSLAAVLFAAWMSRSAMATQPEEVDAAGSDLIPVVADETVVDIALLEFLGQWETDDGEWIAPSDLADETFVELIDPVGSLEMEEID